MLRVLRKDYLRGPGREKIEDIIKAYFKRPQKRGGSESKRKKMNWGPGEKWDEKQRRMKFSSIQSLRHV